MTRQSTHIRSHSFVLVLMGLWVVSFLISIVVPASWDVAWRLEIAERVLSGSKLYTDIIELNPPLWFWSSLPSTYLAHLTGLSPYLALSVAVHLSALFGVWLLGQCVEPLVSEGARKWLLAGALMALLFIPFENLGQREPAVLLAGLLWAALAVRRARSIASPKWLIVFVAVMSGYGFALKHYYLVIPVGIEIWLAFQLKRLWRPLRLETIVMGLLGALYGAAVFKFASHFLTDIVPLINLSYDDVRSANVANPWLHPLYLIAEALLLVVPIYFIRNAVKTNLLAQALVVTVLLQVLVVFLQGKGFSNHFLAAKGSVFALWAFAFGHVRQLGSKLTIHPGAILGFLTLGWIVAPATSMILAKPIHVSAAEKPASATVAVIQELLSEPKEKRVFVLSTNAGLAFYFQWSQHRQHFSRYYAMWMLPGLLTSQLNVASHDDATRALELVRTNTIADIQCSAPQVIIGDVTTHGRTVGYKVFAYDIKPMEVLLHDPSFQLWLATNYNQSSEVAGVTIWRSKSANGPLPSGCTKKG